jgi:hypothetical protein
MQPHDYAAFVWIRANKTILGGTGVAWGMHLWTADCHPPAACRGNVPGSPAAGAEQSSGPA